MAELRGQWSSRFGFILAGAGSAIGLGNIWRFPYVVGENGGAAFVLVYILFVIIIGLPYMFAELALGRSVQSNPVGAIKAIKPKSQWKWAGVLGVITGVGILSFYGVVAGWTIGYIFKMFYTASAGFEEFVSDGWLVTGLFAVFIFLTASIVYSGIEGGIERWSKILMPLLLILMISLIIYANTLKGSSNGLSFYLNPDFSKITGKSLLAALGQAFFSLSLGMGLMITYGSYLSKKEDIVSSASYIGFFDTLIAFMAGLIIFPTIFAIKGDMTLIDESLRSGPGLIFKVFPELFAQIPGGMIVGVLFFVLLSVAALTSTISLLEIQVAYLIDEHRLGRKKIVWAAAAFTFIIGLPSALSQGANEFFTNFGLLPQRLSGADFLSHMSFIFGDLALALGAFLLSIFIGWIWGADKASAEIEQGSPVFRKLKPLWIFMIRYFIPIVIFIILLNLFGIFD
ncbi:MAG: sodium-dependent transporter [Calditrichaceae bacterium]|nr:sodium-dependent transporter [Calditrichaceae bacterium]MBN2709566.1 sodium-dependent transporter [Calditrichaceae bacterium]